MSSPGTATVPVERSGAPPHRRRDPGPLATSPPRSSAPWLLFLALVGAEVALGLHLRTEGVGEGLGYRQLSWTMYLCSIPVVASTVIAFAVGAQAAKFRSALRSVLQVGGLLVDVQDEVTPDPRASGDDRSGSLSKPGGSPRETATQERVAEVLAPLVEVAPQTMDPARGPEEPTVVPPAPASNEQPPWTVELPEPRDWLTALSKVQSSWIYEGERFDESLLPMQLNSVAFGALASVFASIAYLVWCKASSPPILLLTETLLATVVLSYSLHTVRHLVRISSSDFNARMFSWAARSLILACIAGVGAMALGNSLVRDKAGTGEAWIVAAIGGESVLQGIVERAGKIVGYTPPVPRNTWLGAITGLSEEDCARLAEEGVDSAHALAFVPTARLFFNTKHSLQRLVDWQDQALLITYLGPERAKALFEETGIRGMIDLRGVIEALLRARAQKPNEAMEKAISRALRLESGAFEILLRTVVWDEVTLRLHLLWQSTTESRRPRRQLSEAKPSSAPPATEPR